MSDDFKKKAVDINVESLKLYISLSTVSLAGLLTFYSKLTEPVCTGLFYWAILLFLLCAIVSIVIVNHFIIQANENAYDVRTPLSRILNFIAIFLFIGGVITGSIFITKNTVKKMPEKVNNPNGIIIENHKVTVGADCDKKILIETDSLKKIDKIFINYENK